ncbi:metal ABC transporter substrate-binding protein [Sulfurimonas marina]|uniref:Zinc ABC transporter substrate-binding protein n=1 Tax=Sulfurimonas marina TaxID=2590551 RepID=A0A7M1AY83_9BACT|nr:metal ABC transporter substrate-binding protein [Sulfurimonas marina]QOP41518.1 zinc ABC transporter substrate-binding protein [Sulfurimonas marina]
MRKILLLTLLASVSLFAKVNVVTTYAYLGEIVKEVGGENVKVDVLADPTFDPHFVVPKPSLITKLRKADLLVVNGGQLEIGWLPPLLRGAQNRELNVGAKGFLDVSGVITMLNKPAVVSRALGDVHPDGNPHFALDPHNVGIIAKLISRKLALLDSSNSVVYEQNLAAFLADWNQYLKEYDAKMAKCEGTKVVQYHDLFTYFLKRYKFDLYGNIEPLPGITPSSKNTLKTINLVKEKEVKTILQDVYHEKKTAKFIAEKTGAEVVIIPHDVGSVEGTDTLKSFYNTIEMRLCR